MDSKKRNKKIIIALLIILLLAFGTFFVIKEVRNSKNKENNKPGDIIAVEDNTNNGDGEIIESDALENVENEAQENNELAENDDTPVVLTNTTNRNVVRNNTTTNNKPNNNNNNNNNTNNDKPATPVVPDTEKPTASVSVGSSNGKVKSISVTISATDNQGIDKIMYYVGKKESSNYTSASSSSVTINLNNSYSDGTYYIWYYAVDKSGNKSDVKKAGPYKIDNSIPKVDQSEIDANIGGNNVLSNVALRNSDGTVWIDIASYIDEDLEDITLMYAIVGENETVSSYKKANLIDGIEFTTVDSYAEGTYKLYVYLIDKAGNRTGNIINGSKIHL